MTNNLNSTTNIAAATTSTNNQNNVNKNTQPRNKNQNFTNIFTDGAKNFTAQTQPYSRLNIIFATIKEAKDDSENPAGCFRNLYSIVCNSYLAIIVLLLYSGLPIAMLVIGILNINECTIDKKIPVWLIIYGIFGIINCLLRLITSIWIRLKSRRTTKISHESIYIFILTVAIGIFLFVWFCLGNAWVFSVKPDQQSSDKTAPTYCNQLCYEFAFWTIIFFWIVISLAVLFCLSIMLYFAISIVIRIVFQTRVDLTNKG